MTYYLRFRDRPLLCQVGIKGKYLAVPFDPDADVDICITLKAILLGFLKQRENGRLSSEHEFLAPENLIPEIR